MDDMTFTKFLDHIATVGHMASAWWYTMAVLPATIFAGCTYLLMLLALRREIRLLVMLGWLTIAGLPLVLVLPSCYVRYAPPDALAWLNIAVPSDLQQLPYVTVLAAAHYLDQIATLGIVSVALAFGMICASMLIGRFAPAQLVRGFQTASRSLTDALTYFFGDALGSRPVPSALHGLIRVMCGRHQGDQFGVTDGAILGNKEATMTLTDRVVSGQHLRFDVRRDGTYITDLHSTNGSFIDRGGSVQAIGEQPLQLRNGDKIYLGRPNRPESVELVFEQSITGVSR